ncbi:MAG: holo-ACP synthase [Thiobacillus sp.]
MIHGVGTDLLDATRIRDGLERFGVPYAERILAPAEHAAYASNARPAQFLAKSFAAKEALAKALGTGLREPVSLHNIAVMRDALGKPYFELAPALTAWMQARDIGTPHLSLSDEGDLTLAFVVVETQALHPFQDGETS